MGISAQHAGLHAFCCYPGCCARMQKVINTHKALSLTFWAAGVADESQAPQGPEQDAMHLTPHRAGCHAVRQLVDEHRGEQHRPQQQGPEDCLP